MNLLNLPKKWQAQLPGGVVQLAFDWGNDSQSGRTIRRSSEGLDVVRRKLEESIRSLQVLHPYAYVLTNDRTPADPLPPWTSHPRTLDPHVLRRHPHVRMDFDYFAASESQPDDLLCYLIQLDREDISPFLDDLLGLAPPPVYTALLLASETDLNAWVLAHASELRNPQVGMATLLTRFAALLWTHEAEFLVIETRNPALLAALDQDVLPR